MSEPFNPGDTVQLKSGGPLMTFDRENNGVMICVYFDADNKLQTAGFRPEGLKKVRDL